MRRAIPCESPCRARIASPRRSARSAEAHRLARRFLRGLILIAAIAWAGLAAAQGTRADYDRSNKLRARTADKVFRARVTPHWFADGARFWYRVDLAAGQREFVLIDAVEGTRRPAFDHDRLAAALAAATGKPIHARRLPIDGLKFDDAAGAVLIQVGGKTWRCNLDSYELHAAEGPDDAIVSTLPFHDGPRASRRTGAETSITFVNQTKDDVDLFWLDSTGEQKPYGSVRPGQEHRQHTYAGHVWLVCDREGKTLAIFEAAEDGGTAVIDRAPPGNIPDRERAGGGRRTAGRVRQSDSPDGRWQAFFRDFNLHLRDLASGEEYPLSTNGTAEDEYSGRVWWSPDSKKIAAIRTRKGDDRKVYY
ncbi:MAG: DPP IV N-terminal domain-containing protein, partial [Thermoguttaceae bacterium]|nr:DPP IV N-terminal domain-containing protein [Thermoguttaceae bacterium]